MNIGKLNKEELLNIFGEETGLSPDELLVIKGLSDKFFKAICFELVVGYSIRREYQPLNNIGWFYRPLRDGCDTAYFVNDNGDQLSVLMATVDHLLHKREIENS
jgi:hypothetical protein